MFNLEDNDNEKSLKWIECHENTVIQLIQDELKKKIVNEHYIENSKVSNHILNTENIK